MRGRTRKVVYVVSVGAFAGALFVLEWLRVLPSSALEFLYMGLLGMALIPLSILLLSTVVYLGMRPREWPRAILREPPRVAVLYVAYNDLLPDAIRRTLDDVDYPQADVWLLSDSDLPEAQALEDRLPREVRVFRRRERRGGKAGAINDWLRSHAAGVRYVVPMDADAILAPGALRTLVEIAEHPENRRYAGFQTLMETHPAVAPTPFARILGRGVKWGCRILPVAHQRIFGQAMYWGSNALLRVDAVLATGGWVEDNICEDFALTARLDAAGFPVALVDLYNFEGFPPDALSLRERTVRWCRANLAVAPSVFRRGTSFAVRLNVVIPILFYLMAPVLLALLLVNLVAPPDVPLHRVSTVTGAALLAFVFLHRLTLGPRRIGSLAEFGVTLAAETFVILAMALRVAACFLAPLGRAPSWTPSRKRAQALSVAAAIRASIPELAFGAFVVALMVLYGPPLVSVALSSVWVASFLSTPAILWLSSRSGRSRTSGGALVERCERRMSS